MIAPTIKAQIVTVRDAIAAQAGRRVIVPATLDLINAVVSALYDPATSHEDGEALAEILNRAAAILDGEIEAMYVLESASCHDAPTSLQ